MNNIRHLIITGGTGYIGARLAQRAIKSGISVTILARTNKKKSSEVNFVSWSLGDDLPVEALSGDAHSTALVHLAHDWKTLPSQQRVDANLNFAATKTLLDSSRALGLGRFVFVSSQSARPDAPNIYGRVKWKIEQLIDGDDTVTARVGLVYGGPRKGMYGLLLQLVKLPIIPMVSPSQLVQPIHIDELCSGLLLLAQSNLTGYKGLADPIPITFGNFLRSLARICYGHRLIVLPIPLSLALLGCHLTRFIPGIPTIDKERILGLVGTKPIHTSDDLEELKLKITPLNYENNSTAFCRRGLLIEGNTLLRYVLGKKPSRSLLIRYVRAIQLRNHDCIIYGLPALVVVLPVLVRFIEPLYKDHPLAKRLAIATALAEASLDGAQTYLADVNSNKTTQLIRLGISLSTEVFVLPFRLIFGRKPKND